MKKDLFEKFLFLLFIFYTLLPYIECLVRKNLKDILFPFLYATNLQQKKYFFKQKSMLYNIYKNNI